MLESVMALSLHEKVPSEVLETTYFLNNRLTRPLGVDTSGFCRLIAAEECNTAFANTYLIQGLNSPHSLAIDTGDFSHLSSKEIKSIKAALITHAHQDHLSGIDQLNPDTDILVSLETYNSLLTNTPDQFASFLYSTPSPEINQSIKVIPPHSWTNIFGLQVFQIPLPGHTSDSTGWLILRADQAYLAVGDTIWGGSSDKFPSNTDQWQLSLERIANLLKLFPRAIILTGHYVPNPGKPFPDTNVFNRAKASFNPNHPTDIHGGLLQSYW